MSDVFTTADFYGQDAVAPAEPIVEAPVAEVIEEAPEGAEPVAESDDKLEAAVQPTKTYFDPTSVADQFVVLKIGGEEVEVPVSDLTQGYQRQADYTQKTQALAEQRQQVEFWSNVDAAMKHNAPGTLKYLAEQYGITDFAQPAATVPALDEIELTPEQQQLAEFQKQVAPAMEFFQMQQAERQLDQVLTGLSSKYDDFDGNEVMAEAMRRGIADPTLLEAVYRDISFEKYRAHRAANTQVSTERAAAEAARNAAALDAAGVIGNGPSSSGATGAQVTPAHARTVHEAWELAKQQKR